MANEIIKKNTANTIKSYLDKNRSAIVSAMPKGANYDRFCRCVVNAISTTPSLAECSTESLFLSCVRAFSIGIEPNGPTGEGYLVPFKKKGVSVCQFMPSYRGLISLARRSGMVSIIYADAIKKNDKYKISRGTDPKLEHEPAIKERGETLAYYAVARMSDGFFDFETMTPEEVIEISQRSSAVKAKIAGYIKETPWDTDFDEMAKKTVLRRLTKRLPVSVENLAFAQAIAADNKAFSEDDASDIIDIEGIELPSQIEQKPEVKDDKKTGVNGLKDALKIPDIPAHTATKVNGYQPEQQNF